MDLEILETSSDGRYRVGLTPDYNEENPREQFDHLTYAITSDYRQATAEGPLANAFYHFTDQHRIPDAFELFERYAAQTHRAITATRDFRDHKALLYLPAESFHEATTPADLLKAELDEYTSWAEGDVWGLVIQEKQLWRRVYDDSVPDDARPEEEERWATVHDVYGLIGREYAEQEAIDELKAWAKDETV